MLSVVKKLSGKASSIDPPQDCLHVSNGVNIGQQRRGIAQYYRGLSVGGQQLVVQQMGEGGLKPVQQPFVLDVLDPGGAGTADPLRKGAAHRVSKYVGI